MDLNPLRGAIWSPAPPPHTHTHNERERERERAKALFGLPGRFRAASRKRPKTDLEFDHKTVPKRSPKMTPERLPRRPKSVSKRTPFSASIFDPKQTLSDQFWHRFWIVFGTFSNPPRPPVPKGRLSKKRCKTYVFLTFLKRRGCHFGAILNQKRLPGIDPFRGRFSDRF